MAYIGQNLDRFSNVEKLDAITPATATGAGPYNLTKGGVAFTPSSANTMVVSINGVVQYGNFTVSGSTITFTGALADADTCDFIFHMGIGLLSTPVDNTITPAKFSTSGISAGNVIKVNDAGNAWELGNASSAEVYGFERYFSPSTLTKTVTVAGGKFVIDGVSQDTLELLEGNTYKFDLSDSTTATHPFRFATAADAAGSTQYTTGVTVSGTQGQAGAYVQIVVAASAPTLYYYCSSHSGMGGTANTPTPANNSLRYITTNQGQDDITESQYANFSDVIFSASGFTFSINSNGNLITTI